LPLLKTNSKNSSSRRRRRRRRRRLTENSQPEDSVKAKMIMFHGFNDHVNRYYGFFPYLADRGIAVYGLDQRGWGRSVRTDSDKGKTGPTTRVLADMAAFIRRQLPSDVPVFVLGHSSRYRERQETSPRITPRGFSSFSHLDVRKGRHIC
jgi:alpha-beta hydrolase superfamily lysophospholipase